MSSPPGPAEAEATALPSSTAPEPPRALAAVQRDLPTPTVSLSELRHVFPPMTTHWTKPQSCTWTYVADGQSRRASKGDIAWLDLEPRPGASTLTCYPDGMFLGGRTGVFSPATCPDGWFTVSVRVDHDADLSQPTTTAICCSSYYSFDGSHCKRSVPTVLAVPITYDRAAGTYEVMSNSTTTLYSATIAVNTIRALFMEQDKHLFGLTDDEEISQDDEVHDESLSAGARIGIALGVAVFALLSACSREAYAADDGRFGAHDRSVVEPPPAYEAAAAAAAAAATSSTTSPEGQQGDGAIGRQDEIKALVAQKAAIQQRIDALQRVGAEGAQSREDTGA
ncbi:hypothetical protein CDD83_7400 [Cordyceps sp. RAO-2017]|nr:hypothetical protein CDD83_7400 [Cordyceps sp. RAO-2017]